MTWPIMPLAVRVKRTGWPALWLPLIFLWPILIAMFCLALPLCVLVPAPRRSVFATVVATYDMLCSLHGTDVEVSVPEHGTWNISLY